MSEGGKKAPEGASGPGAFPEFPHCLRISPQGAVEGSDPKPPVGTDWNSSKETLFPLGKVCPNTIPLGEHPPSSCQMPVGNDTSPAWFQQAEEGADNTPLDPAPPILIPSPPPGPAALLLGGTGMGQGAASPTLSRSRRLSDFPVGVVLVGSGVSGAPTWQ